ncbi:MAG: hypothetical protein FJ297_00005 [Planctomycetes bacterium]|nr:hypothetical protein [Planctomycetota bacterium]
MKSVLLTRIVTAACLAVGGFLLSSDIAAGEDKEKGEMKAEPRIVKKILKVEYVEEEINPPNLVVTVTGEVPTGGFNKAKLVRVTYVTPPEDGIQDYILFAVPPTGPVIQVISQVEAKDTWKGYTKEGPWIKGLRVHGVDDGVVVKLFSKPK